VLTIAESYKISSKDAFTFGTLIKDFKSKTMTTTDIKIRPARLGDLPAFKAVIDSSELFPADLLDDMMRPFFDSNNESIYWLAYEEEGKAAVAYFEPERMTEGTYNLYLIAVHADYQGGGRGAAMMDHIEHFLKGRGIRILIVETSGVPEFELTRKFYRKIGYTEEARIREFYAEGDDKIVFWKDLRLK